jgi:hypothetical protein
MVILTKSNCVIKMSSRERRIKGRILTVQSIDFGLVESNYERRGIGAAPTKQTGFVVRQKKTNNRKRADVDDGLHKNLSH